MIYILYYECRYTVLIYILPINYYTSVYYIRYNNYNNRQENNMIFSKSRLINVAL